MDKQIITGVIHNNSAMHLSDDITFNSIDVDWEEHYINCEDCQNDVCNMGDAWDMGSATLLIGFKETSDKNEAWYWLGKYGYMPDETADYSAIVGEFYTQVVRSKWYAEVAFCSPCYPGQGDLNTPGGQKTYSLPPDMYDKEYDEIPAIEKIT